MLVFCAQALLLMRPEYLFKRFPVNLMLLLHASAFVSGYKGFRGVRALAMQGVLPARGLARRSLSCLAFFEPTTKTRSCCAQSSYSVAVLIRMCLHFVSSGDDGVASVINLSLS